MIQGIFDIHCHILPGVDDGSENKEESMQMLEKEYADGVRHIILTPHFRREMFEADQELVEEQFHKLQEAASVKWQDLHLYLGCEYHAYSGMVESMQNKERPTMAGSDYVLTEFSGYRELTYIKDRCYAFISNGFIPIIAHAERCENLRRDIENIREMREMGVCIQINADSICGEEGFTIKRFCKKLMKADLIDFVGSDCHGIKHRPPNMGRVSEYIEKKMGTDYATKLLINQPSMIISQ